MLKTFIIDREKDFKVKAVYEVADKTKATSDWGASGRCFSVITYKDFINQSHTGPQMIKIMSHLEEVPSSLKKRSRIDIAKRVIKALEDANFPLTDPAKTSARTGKTDTRTIKLLRKTFKGHPASRRTKCYNLITDGMLVGDYLKAAISELMITNGQALGCLTKLAKHPTTPSIKLVEGK